MTYKKVFVTKFVTHIRNFVTCITNFVIHVSKFVTNFFCADSEKCQAGSENYHGQSKKYPPCNLSGRVGETKRRCIVGDGLLKGLGGKPFSRKTFMLN